MSNNFLKKIKITSNIQLKLIAFLTIILLFVGSFFALTTLKKISKPNLGNENALDFFLPQVDLKTYNQINKK